MITIPENASIFAVINRTRAKGRDPIYLVIEESYKSYTDKLRFKNVKEWFNHKVLRKEVTLFKAILSDEQINTFDPYGIRTKKAVIHVSRGHVSLCPCEHDKNAFSVVIDEVTA